MSFEWNQIRLGDHCTKIGSGATPKGGKDGYLDSGPFTLIRSQNIYNDGFDPGGLAYIGEDQANKLNGVTVEKSDVLLNITGDSVARVCLAPSRHLPARVNQHVAIIRPNSRMLDSRFLRYFLASPRQQDLLLGLASAGATRPALTKVMIENLSVLCPPLKVQQGIADFLSLLDDRIALLRETNATLENIAQALFKSWFVDFDPVHAKQKGRLPEGMDEATAALFPDCFMKAVSGQVPSGWSTDTIKNRTSNVQYGFTQSSTTKPIGPHFLRITDIRDSKVDWQSVPFCAASDAEAEKYRVEDGDIFIARTGASTGENIYIVDPPAAVFASYLIRLQFSSPGIGRIVGEFVRTSAYKNYVAGTIGGSAQPNANAQTLAAASMVFPPEEIASAFYERIRPLDLKKAANSRMAETLASLRDTLLPRLISGQLRLKGTVDESVELPTGT